MDSNVSYRILGILYGSLNASIGGENIQKSRTAFLQPIHTLTLCFGSHRKETHVESEIGDGFIFLVPAGQRCTWNTGK